MLGRLFLPYGRTPREVNLAGRDAVVVAAPTLPSPPPVRSLLDAALASPIGAALPALARGSRVTLIVSDPTRDEPRAELAAAVRDRLGDMRWTLAIANGTHGACDPQCLGITGEYPEVINHDGHSGRDLVDLGATRRGTPVRVHRCVVDADLVIATGCIRPHYFAGFGAGAKAIFPGLGEATAIRINHRLKTEPGARAGVVVGNPCRADLEEAVARVPTRTFLLNGVCGPDGGVHAAVAGDMIAAFRSGAELARPWFTVRAPRAGLVIASDILPVTASLYQAAKIAAAAAPLVAEGGVLLVVAECPDGIGPLDIVNEAIFRIGVLPRLAPGVRLVLASALDARDVQRTLLEPAGVLDPWIAAARGPIVVLPRASQLICEPLP